MSQVAATGLCLPRKKDINSFYPLQLRQSKLSGMVSIVMERPSDSQRKFGLAQLLNRPTISPLDVVLICNDIANNYGRIRSSMINILRTISSAKLKLAAALAEHHLNSLNEQVLLWLKEASEPDQLLFLLPKAKIFELFKEISKAGGAQKAPIAAEALIQSHQPLVRSIARQYENRGLLWQDLLQEANIGLWIAIDLFAKDATYLMGVDFLNYARKIIRDAVVQAIREHYRGKSRLRLDDAANGSLHEKIADQNLRSTALARVKIRQDYFADLAERAENLPPHKETAFILLYVHNKNPEEAGRIMGLRPEQAMRYGRIAYENILGMSGNEGPHCSWRNDPQILDALSQTERFIYDSTFVKGKWMSTRKAAAILSGKLNRKISLRTLENLRQKLRAKLQKKASGL